MGFDNNPIFSVVLTIGVLGFLIYRQVRPRRLSARGLIVVPLIILYFLLKSLPDLQATPTKMIEISISIVVSLILGLLACRQLKVYPSPTTGKAMASGSWTYFLWWLAAFVVKSALSVAFGETSFNHVSQVEILIPVFLLVATRNAYLYWRVSQLGLKLHGRNE